MMARRMKYVELCFNWRFAGDADGGLGEDFDTYTVGKSGVVKITNMTPVGEPGYSGEEFYDVEFEDGSIATVYHPNYAKQIIEEN